MTIKEKVKDWILKHIKNPEQLTDTDIKGIDFVLDFVPKFVVIMVKFSLLSALYLFLLNRYGFEKTMVILMINLIFAVGQVGSAVRELKI